MDRPPDHREGDGQGEGEEDNSILAQEGVDEDEDELEIVANDDFEVEGDYSIVTENGNYSLVDAVLTLVGGGNGGGNDGRGVPLDDDEDDEMDLADGTASSSATPGEGGQPGGGTMPVAVLEALQALDERRPAAELIAKLSAAKSTLAEYLFKCPVPRRGRSGMKVKEELRQRALTWLLVLDYVEQGVEGLGGAADMPEDAMEIVQRVGEMAPHKICQHAFKKNDIVWICKQCQKDETCVLCNNCYRDSNHDGHEVYFYHTQAGGCCDCGDEDAWDAGGFCHRHGQQGDNPLVHFPASFMASARWTLGQAVALVVRVVEAYAQSFDVARVGEQQEEWAAAGGASEEFHLVLHNDDVHSLREVSNILERRLVPEARRKAEMAHQFGEVTLRSGTLEQMRHEALWLQRESLLVSLSTRRLTKMVSVALVHLSWLYKLAGVSGGICRLVVEQFGHDVLSRLMVAHSRLPKDMCSSLHTLYLFLMADQSFKYAVAQSYASTYLSVTRDYGAGVGMAEFSLYSLSVQFLNRSSFVNDLVGSKDFLGVLCRALRDMLAQTIRASSSGGPSPFATVVDLQHMVLQCRRYSPVIADLKFVLNIEGVSARFAATCLDTWGEVLRMMHYIHGQERQRGLHVEHELRDWMFAFNVQISLSSVLDCLLHWVRSVDPASHDAALVLRIGARVLEWIDDWQRKVYGYHETRTVAMHPGDGQQLQRLGPLPRLSFHITLHRFLGFLIREAAKNHGLTTLALKPLLRSLRTNPALLLGLVEMPLSVLVMTSEIRAGMWKRNGAIMPDQVVNYGEPPFCKMFRDIDILQLQFAGLAYGAQPLLNLMLHHYHIYDWFLTPEASSALAVLEDLLGDDVPSGARLPLAEEMMQMIILLVSELPLPPLGAEDRLKRQLRREVIHRLSSGPCPHSEIYDCCHQLAETTENLAEKLLEEILAEVAVRKEARELEAETFALKDAMWAEFDPAFFHMSVQAHQQAAERRPKPKGPTPLVGPPGAAHPVFQRLRFGLLSSETLLHLIRLTLIKAVQRSASPRWSDLLLFRCVHLLTLAMHTAAAASSCATLSGPCGEEEDEGMGFADALFDLIRAEGPDRSRKRSEAALDPPTDTSATGASSSSSSSSSPSTAMLSSSNGTAPAHSILSLLLALPETCKSDPHLFEAVHWLIQTAARLDPKSAALIEAWKQQASSASQADLETRKKQAREKMMSEMNRNIMAFQQGMMPGMEDIDTDDDEDDVDQQQYASSSSSSARAMDQDRASANGGPSTGLAKKSVVEQPECIVCKGKDDKGPLGLAAFLQQSNVLGHCPGTVLHLCGHALHYQCFDEYFATVVEGSESMDHLILDVTNGEFPCPYCKSISNSLVPFIPPHASCTASSQSSPRAAPPACQSSGSSVMDVSPERPARPDLASPPPPPSDQGGPCSKLQAALTRLLQGGASGADKMSEEGEQADDEEEGEEESVLQGVCARFLTDCTVRSLRTRPLSSLSMAVRPLAQCLGVQLVTCDTLAYSLALINAEAGHAVLTQTATGSFERLQLDRLKHVVAVLRDVGRSRSLGAKSARRLAGMMTMLGKQDDDEEDEEAHDKPATSSSHLQRSLLKSNLLSALVLSLTNAPLVSELGGPVEALRVLVPCLAVARVAQVLAQRGGLFGVQPSSPLDPDTVTRVLASLPPPPPSSSAATSSAASSAPRGLDPACLAMLSIAIANHHLSTHTTAEDAGAAKVPVVADEASLLTRTEDLRTITQEAQEVLAAFLSSAVLLLSVLGDDFHPPGYTAPAADASLHDLLRTFNVPSLQELAADASWVGLLSDCLFRGGWAAASDLRVSYPRGGPESKPQFVSLKRSYTELHSELTARAPSEHPTLCLLCNAALNAGRRVCTDHAQTCGAGSGVFFLLQDCTVLLIYKERACYFPSPYVDAYGERHKQYRGRPLFLDDRRLEALRRLWAQQRIAYEVVHSRSAAKQVIFNGYY